jgi:hypothetical protein
VLRYINLIGSNHAQLLQFYNFTIVCNNVCCTNKKLRSTKEQKPAHDLRQKAHSWVSKFTPRHELKLIKAASAPLEHRPAALRLKREEQSEGLRGQVVALRQHPHQGPIS